MIDRHYGQPAGLVARLARWRDAMNRERTLPWLGTGFIDDLECTMRLLNLREFADWLRVNGTAEQQAFAADILADQETLAAVRQAVDDAGQRDQADEVRAVELMAEERLAIRKVLVDAGALAGDDAETPLPDLLRMLLS